MSQVLLQVRSEVSLIAESLALKDLGSSTYKQLNRFTHRDMKCILTLKRSCCFAVLSLLDDVLAFNLLLEHSEVDFVDVVCSHLVLQKLLESGLPLQLTRLHLVFWLLVLEYFNELEGVHDRKLKGWVRLSRLAHPVHNPS